MHEQWTRAVQLFTKWHLGFTFLDLQNKGGCWVLGRRPISGLSGHVSRLAASLHVYVPAKLCSSVCDRLTNLRLKRGKSSVKCAARVFGGKICRASNKHHSWLSSCKTALHSKSEQLRSSYSYTQTITCTHFTCAMQWNDSLQDPKFLYIATASLKEDSWSNNCRDARDLVPFLNAFSFLATHPRYFSERTSAQLNQQKCKIHPEANTQLNICGEKVSYNKWVHSGAWKRIPQPLADGVQTVFIKGRSHWEASHKNALRVHLQEKTAGVKRGCRWLVG